MPKLIYANSNNSDFYYATKTVIPDACFLLELDDKSFLFIDHREFEAFNEHNKNLSLEAVLLNPLSDEAGKKYPKLAVLESLCLHILEKYDLKRDIINVPPHFPLPLADFLRKEGITLAVADPFYPSRLTKNQNEISAIEEALKKTHPAYEFIENVLRKSEIRSGLLYYQGTVLTSEFLKREIEKIFVDNDLMSVEGMIVASGYQSAIPHHRGSGPLKAHVPIICDFFPRDVETRYFSDMTRTYVKGNPNPLFVKMYEVVAKAQQAALDMLKPGITASEIHNECVQVFLESGFDAGDRGFIHGTGHGLGIDIHEAPYINGRNQKLIVAGNVFTIEPGLYYPDIGGVRIEDVVVVTENGHKNLTSYNKQLLIL